MCEEVSGVKGERESLWLCGWLSEAFMSVLVAEKGWLSCEAGWHEDPWRDTHTGRQIQPWCVLPPWTESTIFLGLCAKHLQHIIFHFGRPQLFTCLLYWVTAGVCKCAAWWKWVSMTFAFVSQISLLKTKHKTKKREEVAARNTWHPMLTSAVLTYNNVLLTLYMFCAQSFDMIWLKTSWTVASRLNVCFAF